CANFCRAANLVGLRPSLRRGLHMKRKQAECQDGIQLQTHEKHELSCAHNNVLCLETWSFSQRRVRKRTVRFVPLFAINSSCKRLNRRKLKRQGRTAGGATAWHLIV